MTSSTNNILAFTGKSHSLPVSQHARNLVVESRKSLVHTLTTLLNGLFETVDDALYSLADRSESAHTRDVYFDAMRSLRNRRSEIQEKFSTRILANFDAFWTQGPTDLSLPPTPQADSPGLSLVDEDVLEATLAINDLVAKGENRFHRELYRLNLRFSLALGGMEVDAKSNPLGPMGICYPLHIALQNLALNSQVRLVLYKLFDKQYIQHAKHLYDEIDNIFKQGGVNPAITQGNPNKLNTGVSSGAQATAFNNLQSLLKQQRSKQNGPIGINTNTDLPTVAGPELLGALSALQQSMYANTKTTGQEDVRSQIAAQLALKKNDRYQRVLAPADQDALDLISMLFEFLLTDSRLPDALKVLIARLQIPLLKVAIIDKTFFNENLHPARRLLNTLAKAAAAWSDDGDRSSECLYGRIASIVHTVITTFANDPKVFERLNKDFATYLEHEQHSAEITEQRTNQIIKGKEQLRQAKERVTAEIAKRLNGTAQVPLVVRTLIEEGWKDVLLLTYLRQGDNSQIWLQQLAVADQLVWSVQPKNNHEQRQALLRAIPDLLYQLREGLNGISYDQHRMIRLIEELQSCHLACLRGNEYFQMYPAPSKNPTPPIPSQGEGENLATVDEVMNVVKSMTVGTWLDITENDERQIRVKLSWKNDGNGTYVFVNRKGIKILEMTTNGVARLLRSGKARILHNIDTPIMDLAVDALLARLQKPA